MSFKWVPNLSNAFVSVVFLLLGRGVDGAGETDGRVVDLVTGPDEGGGGGGPDVLGGCGGFGADIGGGCTDVGGGGGGGGPDVGGGCTDIGGGGGGGVGGLDVGTSSKWMMHKGNIWL